MSDFGSISEYLRKKDDAKFNHSHRTSERTDAQQRCIGATRVGGEVGVRVNDKIYKINARWPVAQCRLSNIIG
jgi:hypothetical protein